MSDRRESCARAARAGTRASPRAIPDRSGRDIGRRATITTRAPRRFRTGSAMPLCCRPSPSVRWGSASVWALSRSGESSGRNGGERRRDLPGQLSGNRLIESDRVEGTAVYDPDGHRIGTVEHVMIDKLTGHVAYAVLSFGGFLGFGRERHCHCPGAKLDYDPTLEGYRTDINGGAASKGARPDEGRPAARASAARSLRCDVLLDPGLESPAAAEKRTRLRPTA